MDGKLNCEFEVKLLCEWWNQSCDNKEWLSDMLQGWFIDILLQSSSYGKYSYAGGGCTMWIGG